MENFYDLIKLIVECSGGSMGNVDAKEFIGAINNFLRRDPGNHWLGIELGKTPFDLMILHDIIFEKRPDTIIECGTAFGGSAYYMAILMDLMKIDGQVISIDNCECKVSRHYEKGFVEIEGPKEFFGLYTCRMPAHPKIKFIRSDCLSANLPKLGEKVMVVLDCCHSTDHVFKELEKFSVLVSSGQYIVVEDTDGEEPPPAVEKFLNANDNFIVDKNRERFGISSSPGGYLLRTK